MALRTYQDIIGGNLRRLRQEQDLRQDDLATLARANGLNWTAGTVASIEISRRSLTSEEELLLQATLEVTNLYDKLRSTRGLTERDEIELGDGFILTVAEWRGLVAGQHLSPGHSVLRAMWPEDYGGDPSVFMTYLRQQGGLVKRYGVPTEEVPRLVVAAQNIAETRAARRLKRDPHEVAFAAWSLWGRSLTEERDRRLQEQEGEGDPRALRGHITRTLDGEMRGRIKEANQRKRKGKT